MPQINEARPPYVEFEIQAEEDRAASLTAGHYVEKDVHYAIVTPMGSKDRIPRKVDEWFASLEQAVAEDRFAPEWLARYKVQYEAWSKGQEIPAFGTPIKTWPVPGPAQIRALLACGVTTIEDLAQANEETISRIGMGGRSLKARAADWLASAKDVGKVSEEISALKVANEQLRESNDKLQKQLAEVLARLPKPEETPQRKL